MSHGFRNPFTGPSPPSQALSAPDGGPIHRRDPDPHRADHDSPAIQAYRCMLIPPSANLRNFCGADS